MGQRSSTVSDPVDWQAQAQEQLEWVLAIHFSGNKMPHMSGDPRNRLSDMQRRQLDQAVSAAMEVLTSVVSDRVVQEREACALLCDVVASNSYVVCDVIRSRILSRSNEGTYDSR